MENSGADEKFQNGLKIPELTENSRSDGKFKCELKKIMKISRISEENFVTKEKF